MNKEDIRLVSTAYNVLRLIYTNTFSMWMAKLSKWDNEERDTDLSPINNFDGSTTHHDLSTQSAKDKIGPIMLVADNLLLLLLFHCVEVLLCRIAVDAQHCKESVRLANKNNIVKRRYVLLTLLSCFLPLIM